MNSFNKARGKTRVVRDGKTPDDVKTYRDVLLSGGRVTEFSLIIKLFSHQIYAEKKEVQMKFFE